MGKILVVDDDADLTATIETMLLGTSNEIRCENKSKFVVGIVSSEDFDLVISDVFMPDFDGIELITKIKKANPSTKVLIMTGGGRLFPSGSDALGNIISGAEVIGADAVIMKPFRRQQLVDAVSRLID